LPQPRHEHTRGCSLNLTIALPSRQHGQSKS
jgi:hypothetical protein